MNGKLKKKKLIQPQKKNKKKRKEIERVKQGDKMSEWEAKIQKTIRRNAVGQRKKLKDEPTQAQEKQKFKTEED